MKKCYSCNTVRGFCFDVSLIVHLSSVDWRQKYSNPSKNEELLPEISNFEETPAIMLLDSEVKELLTDTGSDWFYLGDVSEELISSFVAMVETRHDFQFLSRPSRRRLLSAVVECLQNIRNNTPPITTPAPGSVVYMRRESGTDYGLRCGNVMLTKDVEQLKSKLDEINTADPEQLKSMYVDQMERSLQNGSRTNAGLGLMEIARAVNGPINYRFLPLKGEYTFFCLELIITLN